MADWECLPSVVSKDAGVRIELGTNIQYAVWIWVCKALGEFAKSQGQHGNSNDCDREISRKIGVGLCGVLAGKITDGVDCIVERISPGLCTPAFARLLVDRSRCHPKLCRHNFCDLAWPFSKNPTESELAFLRPTFITKRRPAAESMSFQEVDELSVILRHAPSSIGRCCGYSHSGS